MGEFVTIKQWCWEEWDCRSYECVREGLLPQNNYQSQFIAYRSNMYNWACSNSAYVGMAQIVHWNVLAETINILLKTDQFFKTLSVLLSVIILSLWLSYMLRQGF